MVKYLFFFLANILISLSASAQDKSWQGTAISDSVTIDFPANPVKRIIQGHEVCVSKDGAEVFMVVSQEKAIDPEVTDSEKQEFYNGVLKGALAQAGGGEIEGRQPFAVAGFQGVEAILNTPASSKAPGTKYIRLVLVNDVIYSMMCWTEGPSNTVFAVDRQHFFASFHPKAHKIASTPAETRAPGYKMGRLIGNVIVYGGLIAIVVVALRSFDKPKKNKQA